MVDESLKFAWAYLLLHGKVTNGEWCYYLGGWEEPKGATQYGYGKDQMKTVRELVDIVGIDWEKTGVPTVTTESEFQDTFSPSKDCLGTLGTLYLKNGDSYLIGSGDDDAAHLAETAREILKGTNSEVQKLADRL